MKILYVGMKYDYGYPERGLSFEHWNFFESLKNLGHEIIYFDFMSLIKEFGRNQMNQRLMEIALSEEPDMFFSILFESEIKKETIKKISFETDITTLNWFADDHWRFESFSREWAPCFNWVVTTANSALPKYKEADYRNVIKSQWGANHHLYRKLDLPLIYDVTFIGQPHGNRRNVIESLREASIDVRVWGYGWENGRLDQEEMIRVFNQSKLNLNLSNASTNQSAPHRSSLVLPGRNSLSSILDKSSIGRNLKRWRRQMLKKDQAKIIYPEQIKARNFEIPACGGCQITGPAENLDEYFETDSEVVIYESMNDLVDKIRYYLSHDIKRTEITEAGYKRTHKDHTYEERFNEIFRIINL